MPIHGVGCTGLDIQFMEMRQTDGGYVFSNLLSGFGYYKFANHFVIYFINIGLKLALALDALPRASTATRFLPR